MVTLAVDNRRGVIRQPNKHHLTQNAIPQHRMWDVCLGEEVNMTVVNAITHPVDGEHCLLLQGMVQANVGQKLIKRNILRVFYSDRFRVGDAAFW